MSITSGPGPESTTDGESLPHSFDADVAGIEASADKLAQAAVAAVTAAQWSASPGGDASRILPLLRTAAELTYALAVSASPARDRNVPVQGRLREVAPGAPPEDLTSLRWSEALWAATVAGDAATAVRLARIDTAALPRDAAPGAAELAATMAAWWRGEAIVPPLLAALEATAPGRLSGADLDHALDVVTPAIAVLRQLASSDDEALAAAVARAVELHRDYWAESPRDGGPEGNLSLPLAGLARVACEFGRPASTYHLAVPDALLEARAEVTGCPVCAEPFSAGELTCRCCSASLADDAALASSVGRLLTETSQACPACGRTCRAQATRCAGCSTQLQSEA